MEFWCQLLGVLRTKQRVCQQKAETDSMRAQMRSSRKLQPHEHLHEYRIKMILLLKTTASEKLGVNDSRKQKRGKCLAWGNPDLFALQNTAEEEGADQNCFIVADPKGWKLT